MAEAPEQADATMLAEQCVHVARGTYERNLRVLGDGDPAAAEHPYVTVSRLILDSVESELKCATAFRELRRLAADWARDPAADGVSMFALLAQANTAAQTLDDLDARHQGLAAANETSDRRINAPEEVRELLALTRLNQAHWVAMHLLALCWCYNSVARKTGWSLLLEHDFEDTIGAFLNRRDWLVVSIVCGIACAAIGKLAQDLVTHKADPRTRLFATFGKILVGMAEACPQEPKNEQVTLPLPARSGAFASVMECLADLEPPDAVGSDVP